jgi:hypothetical protein
MIQPRGYPFQPPLSDHNHPCSSAVRFAFPISRDVGDPGDDQEAARRKIAAPQLVIVSERRPPGAERSKSAKPTTRPSACVPQLNSRGDP